MKIDCANQKGVTLVELLLVLVIGGIIIAGIYRTFIAQTRAYTVQDQVVEVQQNVRSAMEIIVRDLRMTGSDDNHALSGKKFTLPPDAGQDVYTLGDNSIALNYEYYDAATSTIQWHRIAYWIGVDPLTGSSALLRQRTVNGIVDPDPPGPDVLLTNVGAFVFSYGAGVEDPLTGKWSLDTVNPWVPVAGIAGRRIIAVNVTLTGGPAPINPDVQQRVSPRTLTSIVALRNLCR
jgi:prepilin-type N-terminal cleavage/methylation domain-containing protein